MDRRNSRVGFECRRCVQMRDLRRQCNAGREEQGRIFNATHFFIAKLSLHFHSLGDDVVSITVSAMV